MYEFKCYERWMSPPSKLTERTNDKRTNQTTTVSLAAHAHQGIINVNAAIEADAQRCIMVNRGYHEQEVIYYRCTQIVVLACFIFQLQQLNKVLSRWWAFIDCNDLHQKHKLIQYKLYHTFLTYSWTNVWFAWPSLSCDKYRLATYTHSNVYHLSTVQFTQHT